MKKKPENWKCRELKSFIIDSYFVIQIACVSLPSPYPFPAWSVLCAYSHAAGTADRIWRQRDRRTGSAHIQCWNRFGSFSSFLCWRNVLFGMHECSIVFLYCAFETRSAFFSRDEYAQRKTKNNENFQCGCVCVCPRWVYSAYNRIHLIFRLIFLSLHTLCMCS